MVPGRPWRLTFSFGNSKKKDKNHSRSPSRALLHSSLDLQTNLSKNYSFVNLYENKASEKYT